MRKCQTVNPTEQDSRRIAFLAQHHGVRVRALVTAMLNVFESMPEDQRDAALVQVLRAQTRAAVDAEPLSSAPAG